MCSVSLTVPFIADFVKHRGRGIAYSYTGCLLAFALILGLTILDLDYDNSINKEYFYVTTSAFGLVAAVSLCSFFKDK